MSTEKPTILIVEDDELNNKMICTLVSSVGGYAVLQSRDGKEAITIAKEKQPDLILMDIRLNKAEMDGEEAIVALKSDPATKHIPIVTVSAYALPKEKERFMKAGSDDYVSKPFLAADLLSAIKKHLD